MISSHYKNIDWISPIKQFGESTNDLPCRDSLGAELEIWRTYIGPNTIWMMYQTLYRQL